MRVLVATSCPNRVLCLGHLLWQLKLAADYIHLSTAVSVRSPFIAEGYLGTIDLRVWQHLWEEESILLASLCTYLLAAEGKRVESCSMEEIRLLVTCLVWADIPPPSQLQLASTSGMCSSFHLNPVHLGWCVGNLPDVYLKLQDLGVSDPAHTAVRLMPLLHNQTRPTHISSRR